jgi:hypothetical protein
MDSGMHLTSKTTFCMVKVPFGSRILEKVINRKHSNEKPLFQLLL